MNGPSCTRALALLGALALSCSAPGSADVPIDQPFALAGRAEPPSRTGGSRRDAAPFDAGSDVVIRFEDGGTDAGGVAEAGAPEAGRVVPVLSPSRIVFSASVAGAPHRLFAANADGSDVRQVPVAFPSEKGACWYPRISPDRTKLAFVVDQAEIWTSDFDGAHAAFLDVGEGLPPEWKSDSTAILYARAESIYLKGTDGTPSRLLGQGAGFTEPVWTGPNSLTFITEVEGGPEVDGFSWPGAPWLWLEYPWILGRQLAVSMSNRHTQLFVETSAPWTPAPFESRGRIRTCDLDNARCGDPMQFEWTPDCMVRCLTVVDATDAWLPRWSPDESSLVFARPDGIWRKDEASEPRRIIEVEGVKGLDW